MSGVVELQAPFVALSLIALLFEGPYDHLEFVTDPKRMGNAR